MVNKEAKTTENDIQALFEAGAHFGLIRSRRHPSAKPYLFGVKNKIEIFDLEKTQEKLQEAKEFIKKKVSEKGLILFVGGKSEARKAIARVGESTNMPVVPGRWLGGTLTNFSEIQKRVARLEDLTSQKEKGELSKYTKKERLLIDREIENLQKDFAGLISMKTLPKVLVVVDPKKEITAVREAKKLSIPVVALASSDCNIQDIEYPIPGNDASIKSIDYIIGELSSAVKEGLMSVPAKSEEKTAE